MTKPITVDFPWPGDFKEGLRHLVLGGFAVTGAIITPDPEDPHKPMLTIYSDAGGGSTVETVYKLHTCVVRGS